MSNIDKLKPGKYAILFRNNWDGEGDTYETFAILDAEGVWRDEGGDELLEYQGDEVLKAWPMDDCSNVLALLDELEAKDRRIAELELKLEAADKLQDSAFRHGLQHGFSLGQTDNQAGFEECLSAYGTGKGE